MPGDAAPREPTGTAGVAARGWRVATAALAAVAALVPTATLGLAVALVARGTEPLADTWQVALPAAAATVVLWGTVGAMARPTRSVTGVLAVLLAALAAWLLVLAAQTALPEILDPPLKGGGFDTAVGLAGLVGALWLLAVAAGVLRVRARLGRR